MYATLRKRLPTRISSNMGQSPRDIELQGLHDSRFTSLPLHNDARHGTDPLEIGAEVFRAKVGQHRRSWRLILILSILLSLSLVATAVLGVLYGVRVSEGPRVTTSISATTTTATQSMTDVLTSWDTLTTTSLQSTTQTEMETATMSVTDTTTYRRKTTSVTVIVTTSLFLTTTATTTARLATTATITDTLDVIRSSIQPSGGDVSSGSRWVTTETIYTTVTPQGNSIGNMMRFT